MKKTNVPAKQGERSLENIPSAQLKEPKNASPKFHLPVPEELPAEFRNAQTERLTPQLGPTIKWPEVPPARACGYYVDRKEGIGQNDGDLFLFKYKNLEFGVWETTHLKQAMKDGEGNMKVKAGDFVDIVFADLLDSGQPQPMRVFEVNVYRKP